MCGLLVFLLPSILGIKVFDIFFKKAKIKDLVINYLLMVLLSNTICIGIIIVLNKHNGDIFLYMMEHLRFYYKYLLLSMFINIILGFLIYKLDVEILKNPGKKSDSSKKKIKKDNLLHKRTLFLLILIVVMVFVFIRYRYKNDTIVDCDSNVGQSNTEVISNGMDIDNIKTLAKKVMFVAHPDDETLWGSSALHNEKYLVVCVTCGGRKDRVSEFKKVMSLTKDDYIMLNYPDLVKGKKSDWKDVWNDINKDIEAVLKYKDWDLVVTHNPDGEYGHIHHKNTNKIVTKYANHDKLTYFGRFYWGDIPNDDKLYRLKNTDFDFKMDVLIPVYATQKKAISNLKNMFHYESWITYNEWYGDESEKS